MNILENQISAAVQLLNATDIFLTGHSGLSVLFGGLIGAVIGQFAIFIRSWQQQITEKRVVRDLLKLEIEYNFSQLEKLISMLYEMARNLDFLEEQSDQSLHPNKLQANILYPPYDFEDQAYKALIGKLPIALTADKLKDVQRVYGGFRTAKYQYESLQEKNFRNLRPILEWMTETLKKLQDETNPLG